ncbi:MAG: alpha/beta hydrolase [Phycisphaerales bacterium]
MHHLRLLVGLACFATFSACSTKERMPPTPNVLRDGSGSARLLELPPAMQRPEMEILYVTDRAKDRDGVLGPEYGFGRSMSLSYGTATVSLGEETTWEEVVRMSGQGEEHADWELELTEIDEVGSVGITAEALEVVDGQLRRNAAAELQLMAIRANFIGLVKSKMEQAPSKDLYVYVHGFNNSFYDSIARAAILWHSISRQGVFLSYTWPAGSGGALGYFYDRESGEFTIFHLREVIRLLAQVPGVERLHIIAHSRGTDVATTALRELNIALRAQGRDPQQALKLESLVLAAPDLDLDVFAQRFWIENLGAVAKRTAIYFSSEDGAIGFSNWLFGSRTRIGTLSNLELTPVQSKLFQELKQINLIECQVSGYGSSHAYVFGDPAAMSDVVAVLRDRRDAGAEHGRPLEALEQGTWLLTDDYFAEIDETEAGAGEAKVESTVGVPDDRDR